MKPTDSNLKKGMFETSKRAILNAMKEPKTKDDPNMEKIRKALEASERQNGELNKDITDLINFVEQKDKEIQKLKRQNDFYYNELVKLGKIQKT